MMAHPKKKVGQNFLGAFDAIFGAYFSFPAEHFVTWRSDYAMAADGEKKMRKNELSVPQP